MKRVVIADDSKMARAFIRRSIEIALAEDAEYVEAVDGQDAFEKMKDAPTDLLVTDLNMPKMNGTQLLRRIIASPRLHGTPSIVVTSLLNPAKEKELRELGASEILGKPLSPTELSDALSRIFEKTEEENYGW